MAREALVLASEENASRVVLALTRGWNVRVARTAAAAIERAGNRRPDVVVIEVELLGDSAAVVVRHLQLRWGRRLPILGIASSRPSDFLAAELGLFDALLLPIDAAAVLTAANQAPRLRQRSRGALLRPTTSQAELRRGRWFSLTPPDSVPFSGARTVGR